MSSLTSAHLQRRYSIFIVAVIIMSAALFAGVLFFGQTSATIVITPRPQEVSADLAVTVGTTNDSLTLKGTAVTDTISTSVTATPTTSGTPVNAHATGSMTVINKSSQSQPLASGTRFRAPNGQVVRTNKIIDIAQGSEVTVTVVADALGAAGNLEPGKFIIVALWPGLQQQIYGELRTAMTGGTTLSGATLDLDSLTKASDIAQKKMNAENTSRDGTVIVLTPKNVATSPNSSIASAEYKVTVTMSRLTISYATADLQQILRDALTATVPAGLQLTTIDAPEVTVKDMTNPKRPTLRLKAIGTANITDAATALTLGNFTSKLKTDVQATIAALSGVAGVAVMVQPSWKKSLPNATSDIQLTISSPAP